VKLLFRILYRFYRLISWTRYSLRRRFTVAGWMVLAFFLVALLMGMDTENTVAYQAFPALLFLLIVSIAFSGFFKGRFSATRILPRFGSVGVPLHYRVQVRNLASRPESGLTLLENLADPRPSFAEWHAVMLADERKNRGFRMAARTPPHRSTLALVQDAAMPPMGPNETVEAQLELLPFRRGVIRFTGLTLARPDPLGLFRAFSVAPCPQSILILPKRYPIPPVAMPGISRYQEHGVALASNIGRSDEFVSLRDYRSGDPYRHIHWRSWAKTGKPIVKEFEDEFFVRHALVLDTFTDDPRSEVFEEAVSVAASFASALDTQESLLDLLFVGAEAFCFTAGRGLAHADHMLEILAAVRTCSGQPFNKLSKAVLEHARAVSGCICVLLAWDKPRQDLVEKLTALGVPLTILVLVDRGQTVEAGPFVPESGRFHVLEAGKIQEGLAAL
jgi:uncharacterized protein (DUF58 family)